MRHLVLLDSGLRRNDGRGLRRNDGRGLRRNDGRGLRRNGDKGLAPGGQWGSQLCCLKFAPAACSKHEECTIIVQAVVPEQVNGYDCRTARQINRND